jgi:hypothetical protein
MSRRNKFTPKYGKCTPELLQKAKTLVVGWRKALEQFTDRKDNTYINGIDNNSTLIPEQSLTATICGWIEHNPDWEAQWQNVLGRIPTCAFLNRGFNGFIPDLNWLFAPSRSERGIEKVLSGYYDRYTTAYRPRTEDDKMM